MTLRLPLRQDRWHELAAPVPLRERARRAVCAVRGCDDRAASSPRSLEAEQAALGAIMLGEGFGDALEAGIVHASFDYAQHQVVWGAMVELAMGDHVSIDPVTVIEKLTDLNYLRTAGGREAIDALLEATPSVSGLPLYCSILLELQRLRTLLAESTCRRSTCKRCGRPVQPA